MRQNWRDVVGVAGIGLIVVLYAAFLYDQRKRSVNFSRQILDEYRLAVERQKVIHDGD